MNRTERVLFIFGRLLGAPGVVSAADLAHETGRPHEVWRLDIELLRRFVRLEQIGTGRATAWALPGRGARSRVEVAYELVAGGKTWTEAAAELGYSSAASAHGTARKFARATSRPWPPTKIPLAND